MYFKLTGRSAHRPCRWMADWPYIDDADFDLGERITAPVPTPLEFVLEPLLFRLAEATGSLFVHDRLRQHLLAAGFDELTFIEPGEAFV